MKSVSLTQSRPVEAQPDLNCLAGPRYDESFRRAEALFDALPLDEKVERVWSFTPSVFQIESTSRCNLNCPLCSTHHLRRGYTETPSERVEKIVAENPGMRYACLHLMGEPLLSESIFEIVRVLKSKGIYTYFASNGMLLEERAAEIVRSGLDKLSVSVDGMTQEDLARYRRGASLEKIVSGLQALLRERLAIGSRTPLVQVQTVMFPYNEAKEASLKRFFQSLAVDRLKFKKPSFETFGGRNDETGSFDRFAAAPGGAYSRQREDYIQYRKTAVCRMLFQGFVLSDGAVVPCCIDYDGRCVFGNLREQNWREIWFSSARRRMLKRFFSNGLEICKTCSLGYDYSTTVWEKGTEEEVSAL